MCDENCSIYDQCCSDAKYRNNNRSSFVCVETFFDGNIYMKNACKFAKNDTISNLCTDRSINGEKNTFSVIPVTSKSTNITYKNLFCALCNGEKKFRFWNVAILPKNQSITIDSFVNETFLGDSFFSKDWQRNYTIRTKIPKNFIPKIRYCVPDRIKNCLEDRSEINPDCFDIRIDNLNEISINSQNCFAGNMIDRNIPTIKARNIPFDYCKKIPTDNSAYRMLCRKNFLQQSVNTSDTELTYVDSCFYQTIDGDLCLINSFYYSDQFKILDEETIYVYELESKFSHPEWFFSSQGNSSVFVCGTEIPLSSTDRWFSYMNTSLSATLISISIFCLILYIVLYNNIRKMRYPFSRVIFCYSLTLLATFVIFLINDWQPSCEIMSAILHYLLLSCFTWLMVASFECWRTVTSPTSMRNSKEHTWKRFGIYCLVGWVLPLSIVSVAIYFELSPIQSIPCDWKPGYGRLKQCFIAQNLPSYYFFHYPSVIMFLVNIYFFIHISVYVFCNSSVHRNFSIFAKLALVTGLPWTLGTLVVFTKGAYILRLIYVIFNSSQGITIFLVFAYDKEIFTEKFNKLYGHFFKKSQTKGNNGEVSFQANTDIHTSRTSIREYF